MKRSLHRSLFALLPLALAATAAWAAKGGSEEFHWTGTLAAGKSVEVSGINGPIEIVAGTGDRVEVHAIKTGKKHDPSEVRVDVVPDATGLLVCAVYPGGRNACERGGSQHVRENDVQVDFRVVVPAGAQVAAHTVNGAVRVSGVRGRVRASTVNGDCEIATRGSGEASTVNGEVRARLGSVGADDRLEFTTVNGGVSVSLPSDANTAVEASTVNGSIETEFPMTVQGRWGPRHMNGKIGSGAGRLRLTTVNGSIRMARSDAKSL